MNPTSPDSSIIGVSYGWINIPMAVSILFAFAGTVYVGIYLLRTWRARRARGVETKVA